MKDNYEGFLNKLVKFKNDSTLTQEQKDVMINLFKSSVNILENAVNYQKLKAKSVFKIEVVEDELLVSFFGNDDIIENEEKLNKLKEMLKEIEPITGSHL